MREDHERTHDAEARRFAAGLLLRTPSRTGVEVWRGDRLVYRRLRTKPPEHNPD